ncbi:MAG: tetratricopeptide repeat protein [Planctomycetota bacterium]
MRKSKAGFFLVRKCSFVLLLTWAATGLGSVESAAVANEMDGEAVDFVAFRKAVEASDDPKAMSIGDSILKRLEQKYRNDAGFVDYKSKLNTAKFLASQMEAWLRKATQKQTLSLVPGLLDKTKKDKSESKLSTAPAKNFYQTSAESFSKPIRVAGLEDKEKTFLAQYYDLNLRLLTSAIAKAGQALAIADPNFKGTHDFVLVLPLLHALDEKPLNIDVLPRWMRHPRELSMFSDSCLLTFGSPFHAMMVAKKSAQREKEPFSEVGFYRSAARKCGESRSHIAAECLLKAMDAVPVEDSNTAVALQFEIVQMWLNSRSYALAARQARKIFETYPDHEQSGKAMWLYYYALSQGNNADEILAHINEALNERRCATYKAKLMFIKWCALSRKREDTARAALECELLSQYDNDSIVAPVLLSRVVDMLARNDNEGAHAALTQLIEKFPSSRAGVQGKRLLERLKTNKRGP